MLIPSDWVTFKAWQNFPTYPTTFRWRFSIHSIFELSCQDCQDSVILSPFLVFSLPSWRSLACMLPKYALWASEPLIILLISPIWQCHSKILVYNPDGNKSLGFNYRRGEAWQWRSHNLWHSCAGKCFQSKTESRLLPSVQWTSACYDWKRSFEIVRTLEGHAKWAHWTQHPVAYY